MRRYIIGSIIIVGLSSFYLCYAYREHPIDKTYSCTEYVVGDVKSNNIEVELHGKLIKSIIRKDYIEYILVIDGVNIPFEGTDEYVVPVNYSRRIFTGEDFNFAKHNTIYENLHEMNSYYSIRIFYTYYTSDYLHLGKDSNYGRMYLSKDLEEFIIVEYLEEDSSNFEFGLGSKLIVSAENIEESEGLVSKVKNN